MFALYNFDISAYIPISQLPVSFRIPAAVFGIGKVLK